MIESTRERSCLRPAGGRLARNQMLIAYSTTAVRLIVICVSAIFLTGERSTFIVEQVDESRYCRA